jgi:hypothetical protein
MSTALTFPTGSTYDMLAEPLGPYRLTLAELAALPISAERRQLRLAIRRLEQALWSMDAEGMVRITPDHDLAQPRHHIMPGVYIREMHLFKGLCVVGKRHAQQHFNIVTKGKATVTTEMGTQLIEGPCQFMGNAGAKRALLVHEDMVWMTVHKTNATTLEEAEAELMIAEPMIDLRRAA